MSRIGKKPIPIPSGVEVTLGAEKIEVKGPKGALQTPIHPTVAYAIDGGAVTVTRVDDSRIARAQHGLRRTLLANAIAGVFAGFSKTLEVIGVGYKVAVSGSTVELNVGFFVGSARLSLTRARALNTQMSRSAARPASLAPSSGERR